MDGTNLKCDINLFIHKRQTNNLNPIGAHGFSGF